MFHVKHSLKPGKALKPSQNLKNSCANGLTGRKAVIMERIKERIFILGIENVSMVKAFDFSDYQSEKSNDGGMYGFTATFRKVNSGKWAVKYGSTADMDFCPCCGQFSDHYIEDEGFSCSRNGDLMEISTAEMLEEISGWPEVVVK